MKPSSFEYFCPDNLDQALQAISRHGDNGKILAGGQSLVPMMNLRLVRPQVVIDINRIAGLDTVQVDHGELVIGALTRHTRLRESALVATQCPLMNEAYEHVAHKPIRNRGTLGGNISHADPASEMPAVLLATDATIVVKSVKGERVIKAAEFFLGPLQTALASGEMVISIRIPSAPAKQGWAFEEESVRKGDFALAAVGVTLGLDGGICTQVALAVAGMGDRPVRLTQVEALLKGKTLDDALIEKAAALGKASVSPYQSYHADAEFKRELVEALTRRALDSARSRCR